MIGTHLSHYRVIAKLGAGGMGEVYRAEGTTLGRQVAIKVLPDLFSTDAERLARFEREAKVLASLNHSNIAAIYGLEQARDRRLLVLELVEGETLAQRISRKALPLAEALEICRQIAEGLEAAHDRGVIHRDLKPSNVMVTSEGKVKILDFGLAKAFADQTVSADSPTITETMTRPGVVLGTAAYMAPEQAKGKAVDKRVDVWAFGCVLYECLTGQRAFRGERITEVLARILESEPDWGLLPQGLPANIRTVLKWCLRKDASKRLRDLGDVRLELEETARPGTESIASRAPGWRLLAPWAVAASLGVVALVALWRPWNEAPIAGEGVVKLEVELPEGVTIAAREEMAISPDGKHIALVARKGGAKQVYVRSLEQWEGRPIQGTEGALAVCFSPDSQWLAYATATRLWKVPCRGGQPIPICEVAGVSSACWADDDAIYFGSFQYLALARVNASGGVPQVVSRREGQREWIHRDPEVVSGGKALLFGTAETTSGRAPGNIIGQSLPSGDRKTLLEGASFPRYAASGHLVYQSGASTMAVPFDKDGLTLTGSPVLIEGVSLARFSRQGTLVSAPSVPESLRRLIWVDRKGTEAPVIETKRYYYGPRVSPDGSRLAFWIAGPESHVWILDLRRGMMEQFTTTGRNFWCAWSPDGSKLAFISRRSQTSAETAELFCRTIDGSSPEEQLTEGPTHDQPTCWTRDGKSVLFQRSFLPQTGWDLMIASLGSNRAVRPLLASPANESRGELSPDNRWLAYVSTEGGTPGVFVRAFQGPDRKRRISQSGVSAVDPLWSPDGQELFYRDIDAGNVMGVRLNTAADLSSGTPEVLFPDPYPVHEPYGRTYDITPDGRRFIMVKSVDPPPRKILVALNWFEELKRLSAASK